MNNRLKQFIAAENITQSQFAEKIQVVRASVSHVLSGRNNPGYDFIKAIMLAYPNLNIEWLMIGKGKMYKDSSAESTPLPDPVPMPEGSLFYEVGEDIYEDSEAQTTLATFEDLHTDTQVGMKNGIPEQIYTSSQPAQQPINQRKAVKVVIFFNDGTYQEM